MMLAHVPQHGESVRAAVGPERRPGDSRPQGRRHRLRRPAGDVGYDPLQGPGHHPLFSRPPLAVFWNNQGLAKNDFKVALAVVRWTDGSRFGVEFIKMNESERVELTKFVTQHLDTFGGLNKDRRCGQDRRQSPADEPMVKAT